MMQHNTVITPELLDLMRREPLRFRVLQEMPDVLGPFPDYQKELEKEKTGARLRTVNIVDVETTGLDKEKDEIIELAIVKCTFDFDNFKIASIEEVHRFLNEPQRNEISPKITELTGLTYQDVKGHRIDWDAIAELLDCALFLAHNAEYDFQMMTNNGKLPKRRWACTLTGIDWPGMGSGCQKLGCLAGQHSLFFDAHKAVNDCVALAHMLHRNTEACRELLQGVFRDTWLCKANDFPFGGKDDLRAQGFRPKYVRGKFQFWYKGHMSQEKAAELKQWLTEYQGYNEQKSTWTKQTAYDRFAAL